MYCDRKSSRKDRFCKQASLNGYSVASDQSNTSIDEVEVNANSGSDTIEIGALENAGVEEITVDAGKNVTLLPTVSEVEDEDSDIVVSDLDSSLISQLPSGISVVALPQAFKDALIEEQFGNLDGLDNDRDFLIDEPDELSFDINSAVVLGWKC